MSLLRSRETLAGVLCAAALAGIVMLFAISSLPEGAKQLAVVAVPALWVAAALLLTPFRRPGATLTNAATLAYAFAFLLPAATARGPESQGVVWGFQAFVLGIGVVPIAWTANFAFVAALALLRRGDVGRARRLAFLGALVAVTAPLTLTPDLPVSVGFVVWAAAPAVLGIALGRARSATAGVSAASATSAPTL